MPKKKSRRCRLRNGRMCWNGLPMAHLTRIRWKNYQNILLCHASLCKRFVNLAGVLSRLQCREKGAEGEGV